MLFLSIILFILGLAVAMLADKQRRFDVGEINWGYQEDKSEDPAWKFWNKVERVGWGLIFLGIIMFVATIAT